MKRIVALTLVLGLVFAAAPALPAQEAEQEEQAAERMFVMLTYVTVGQGMTGAFLSALEGHREWHESTNDTHYYTVAQVISGPRTGQYVWAAGPMSGTDLDDFMTFLDADFADWNSRGGEMFVEGMETHIYETVAGIGNPPPPDYQAGLINIYEVDLDFDALEAFHEALVELDAIEAAIGHDDHYVWTAVVSGDSATKRHYVQWIDSWANHPGYDPERQAAFAAESGGESAYRELMQRFGDGIDSMTVHTVRSMPALSFQPPISQEER